MDTEGLHGVRRGVGKKEGKFSRRIWSVVEEESLLIALKEIARNGWKSENGFRTGYLGALEQLMLKSCPNSGLKSDPHISSKIHVWKKTYSCLTSMLGKSGFGWDESAQMVTATEDAFQSYFKVDPFARTLRHKSFPYYPSWADVFGKDRASGTFSLVMLDSPGPIRPEHVPGTPECYVPSPDPNVYGEDHDFMAIFAHEKGDSRNDHPKCNNTSSRKRKVEQADLDAKFEEKINSFVNTQNARLGEMSTRFGIELEDSRARKSVWDAVDCIPGLAMNDKCMIAKKLVNNKNDLDLFFSMPESAREPLVKLMLAGAV